ncbi:MAG: hypothetical protein WCH04_20470 [Gammaproteobacteria bacterium]
MAPYTVKTTLWSDDATADPVCQLGSYGIGRDICELQLTILKRDQCLHLSIRANLANIQPIVRRYTLQLGYRRRVRIVGAANPHNRRGCLVVIRHYIDRTLGREYNLVVWRGGQRGIHHERRIVTAGVLDTVQGWVVRAGTETKVVEEQITAERIDHEAVWPQAVPDPLLKVTTALPGTGKSPSDTSTAV